MTGDPLNSIPAASPPSRCKAVSLYLSFLLVTCVAAGGGCIAVPVPHREAAYYCSRPLFTPQQLAALRPAETRRTDVLLMLGEPDVRWHGDRTLLYANTTSNVKAVGLVAGGGIIYNDLPERTHVLVCRFDAGGTLRRSEVRTYPITTFKSAILKDLWARWGREASSP